MPTANHEENCCHTPTTGKNASVSSTCSRVPFVCSVLPSKPGMAHAQLVTCACNYDFQAPRVRTACVVHHQFWRAVRTDYVDLSLNAKVIEHLRLVKKRSTHAALHDTDLFVGSCCKSIAFEYGHCTHYERYLSISWAQCRIQISLNVRAQLSQSNAGCTSLFTHARINLLKCWIICACLSPYPCVLKSVNPMQDAHHCSHTHASIC